MQATDPALIERVRDRVVTRILRLPRAANRYQIIRAVRIPMRDGAELIADRYVPITSDPAHTVLIRSPYGRGYPFPHFYAAPLATRGFHVIVQSVRGTYGSAGAFEPAVNEAADGLDTVAWLRQQPWFTGRLATIGSSYLGMTQWALMQDPPPELAAAVVLAAPHDLSAAWATGSFALADRLSYADGVAHEGERIGLSKRARNLVKRRGVDKFASMMPLSAVGRAALGPDAPLFESWLTHPDRTDNFWEPQRFDDALNRCRVPVLLINGWQDLFLDQTLEQYRRLRERGVEVALTIGPWVHARMLRKGASTFVPEALDWLTSHVAGTAEMRRRTPVRIFVIGHGWVDLSDWPPVLPHRVFSLQPGGGLGDVAPPAGAQPSSFAFDPAHPTPTIGGPLLEGGGYRDDTALATRSDVVCFDGEPLTRDLYVIGEPLFELTHSADNVHVDVFVRMSEVAANGQSTNVSEGFRRFSLDSPRRRARVDIKLHAIAHRFQAGSRIRIIVAGGSHPRFARNPGTGEPVATAERLVPATHYVHHGAGGTSQLLLPATDGSPFG